MKLIEKSKDQMTFEADIEDSVANAIRRYLSQVPVAAIDELEISKNDSPLYDETIAHRTGLIPLKKEKVSEKSKLKLNISKEGTVYSGDIKGHPEIVHKGIPITTLAKGQELEFTANIRLGRGAEHAKFSPGLMFYRNSAEISLDKDLLRDVKEALPDAEIKEKGGKVVVMDDKKKEVTDICEQIARDKKKKAEVVPKKELIITVESFGQMEPKEVFLESIDTLKKDLAAAAKAINKEK